MCELYWLCQSFGTVLFSAIVFAIVYLPANTLCRCTCTSVIRSTLMQQANTFLRFCFLGCWCCCCCFYPLENSFFMIKCLAYLFSLLRAHTSTHTKRCVLRFCYIAYLQTSTTKRRHTHTQKQRMYNFIQSMCIFARNFFSVGSNFIFSRTLYKPKIHTNFCTVKANEFFCMPFYLCTKWTLQLQTTLRAPDKMLQLVLHSSETKLFGMENFFFLGLFAISLLVKPPTLIEIKRWFWSKICSNYKIIYKCSNVGKIIIS